MEQGVHVGGWEVVGEIDRGAIACLYEGRSGAGDPIAVEVLLPGPAEDPATRARFLRGAGSQAALRHPSLVRVHAAGDGPPSPFVVCDLHPGPHLADRLRAGDLGVEEALDRLGDIAEAVDALHAAGVLHGALQPDAILGDGPHALLTGVGRGGSGPGGLVAEAFRAPELSERTSAGEAADRFALAGVLFLALTGGLPFTEPAPGGRGKGSGKGKGRRERQAAAARPADGSAARRTLTSVRALRPELPTALDAVFARALDPDPARRPATAEAVVELARDALEGEGLTLGPAPATAALGLPSRAKGPGPALETVDETSADPDAPALEVGEPTAAFPAIEPDLVPQPDPEPAPAGRSARPRRPEVEDDPRPARAAVRHQRPPQPSGWVPPQKRGGRVRRWFVRLVALIAVLAAGAAIAAIVLTFVDLSDGSGNAAPALPDGLYTLGSALKPGGVASRDCLDRSGGQGSPDCSILQVSVVGDDGKGRRLVVPRASTVRAWAVRGAKGPMAIQVVRRVDGGRTVQVARSSSQRVPDDGPHRYQVCLPVQPGDHVGLLLGAGAKAGVRLDAQGALTERWTPPLGGSARRPTQGRQKGFAHELLLRADLATQSSQRKGSGC